MFRTAERLVKTHKPARRYPQLDQPLFKSGFIRTTA